MKTIYNEQYFSSKEISKELDISEITVRNYFRSGVIKGVKIGNIWHCKKSDVINFLTPNNNHFKVEQTTPETTEQTKVIETIEIPFENTVNSKSKVIDKATPTKTTNKKATTKKSEKTVKTIKTK